MRWIIIALSFTTITVQAGDLILQPISVAPNVYAVIGELTAQTYANDGLNNNLGFIVTQNGVLVVNSGPSLRVAKALHEAIKKQTTQPIRWVVNLNSQNHYWLGNSYFKSLGATLIASQEAARVMHELGSQQLEGIQLLLKEKAKGTTLSYPSDLVVDKREQKLGGVLVQFFYFGPAHTPGDMALWLPEQKILFAGDLIFTERLLLVLPTGDSGNWITAFDKLASLNPHVVVPGHGRPTTLEVARHDTRDYLSFLRTESKRVFDNGGSLQDAVERTDQSRFAQLINFDLAARRNMQQVYQEVESASF